MKNCFNLAHSILKWGFLIGFSVFFVFYCSKEPTKNNEEPVELGAFDLYYDSTLIAEFITKIDSTEYYYFDDEGYYRKGYRPYPTIWWQSFDSTSTDTVISYYSLNDTQYLHNETRTMYEGRYYTYWRHQNDTSKVVWIRCDHDNKTVFKSGFRIRK